MKNHNGVFFGCYSLTTEIREGMRINLWRQAKRFLMQMTKGHDSAKNRWTEVGKAELCRVHLQFHYL